MDRTLLEQHLVQAERHIAQSERHVHRQRELTQHLATKGHDTTQAEYLLKVFEHTLASRKSDREWIRNELAKSDQ